MLKLRQSRAGMGRVWRILAVLTLVLAIGVSLMPSASAYAASSEASAESASYNGRWYTVRAGDTLGGIARYSGTTVSQLMQANGLTSSRIYVGQQLWIPSATVATSCTTYYYVQQGDNLSSIARAYGINVNALANANGLTNASLIYPGQRICIPNIWTTAPPPPSSGGCYYTVQQGDNLSRIAARYGTTVQYLAQVNHISNPSVIIPGQRIYVC